MDACTGISPKRRALLVGAGCGLLLLWAAPYANGQVARRGTKSKIGVIGSGRIGGTIGGLWVKAGHPVMFASRHPEELKSLTDSLGYFVVEVEESGTFQVDPRDGSPFCSITLVDEAAEPASDVVSAGDLVCR